MHPKKSPYNKWYCNYSKVNNNIKDEWLRLNKAFIILKINFLCTDELNSWIIKHLSIYNEEDYFYIIYRFEIILENE